jgi:hypothetical protein
VLKELKHLGRQDDAVLNFRLHEVLLELQELKLQRATEHAQSITIRSAQMPSSYVDRLDYPHKDYVTMIEALLCLTT